MENLTKSHKNLIDIVEKLGRRGLTIPAGPAEKDAFGRRLKLENQAVDSEGKLKPAVLEVLEKLQKDEDQIETILRGEVMWYDVRSSVLRDHPEVVALFALAYASELVERSGQKDGHTLNIAVDCYPKHFEAMSYFVDTIIRTGIFENGGGVVYWGVQNGGSIRNVAQYEKAVTGQGGNWVYGTMSHRAEDYVGMKFGMLGKVFCGSDLRENLYNKLIKGQFPEIIKVTNPEDYVINVGDLTPNNIDVAEDLIRARTGTTASRESILRGVKLGLNMCGSPVGKNLLDILTAFGADVKAENTVLNENFSIANITDPNEHESDSAVEMKTKSREEGRTYLAVDPDGDRASFIALNKAGDPVSMTGTELLLLAMENLATYNPQKLANEIIFDMRTGVSVGQLSKALEDKGFSSRIIASEPGYPFFMEMMEKEKNAVIAVENTGHGFMTPFSNPIWGAKKYFPGVQGGDDASLLLVYLLAVCSVLWEGRNPVQALEFIQEKYNLPKTTIREFKPKVDKRDALRKYDIAEKMCEIAKNEIEPTGRYKIDTMNSGVRITTNENDAMVLVRYSNTGPSFTASGESNNSEKGEFMFRLGGAVMNLAIEKVKTEKGEFVFDWADFAVFGDISSEEAEELIKAA